MARSEPAPARSEDRMSPFAEAIFRQKYSMNGQEEWEDTARRVATNVMAALDYDECSDETHAVYTVIRDRKFLPGGRYLYASGRSLHQVQNCLLLRAEDSREGWGDLWQNAGMALMTGAGIGVEYSLVRAAGLPVNRTGGYASGPVSLMQTVNEIGRQVMQGGSRRSAIWAGLRWDHADVFDFIRCKDWSPDLRKLKEKDFTFPAPMELTNISVVLDDTFFAAYHDITHHLHHHAREVYRLTVRRMCKTGEPGFSVDTGVNAGEDLRNACTEVTSRDDSDVCNLGSVNLARIDSPGELAAVTEIATLFLLAGTVYSHVPYEKVKQVRDRNRRLGLGVMGLHEWLLQRGDVYTPNPELESWMRTWQSESDRAALRYANEHSLSVPVKKRAIAPTGTIAIIAETTTGIEPIFCTAYRRRYLKGSRWHAQYVVDPTAQRMVEQGVHPDRIEDAYTLSLNVERRVSFQAWVQQFVDHGISSTINLPFPLETEDADDFGDMLLGQLPLVRGITVYPNGARGGQPITAAPYEEAVKHRGVVFEESEERCVGGACGI